ncbi:hypothetical protein GF324_00130, partial [bacterium]|nr:hypothetical protein [bacterium]
YLHNTVQQEVVVLRRGLERIRSAEGEEALQTVLRSISEQASNLQEKVRELSHSIVPLLPDKYELPQALEQYTDSLRSSTDAEIFFEDLTPDEFHTVRGLRIDLFKLTQEAVNNALKHADSSLVHIRLELTAGMINLQIRDDGEGFDPEIVQQTSVGLNWMKRCLLDWNGTVEVRSAPGKGTVVEAQVANVKK